MAVANRRDASGLPSVEAFIISVLIGCHAFRPFVLISWRHVALVVPSDRGTLSDL
jgi:hypothetical protein